MIEVRLRIASPQSCRCNRLISLLAWWTIKLTVANRFARGLPHHYMPPIQLYRDTVTDLAVPYERPLSFAPLFAALARNGIAYAAIDVLDRFDSDTAAPPAPYS